MFEMIILINLWVIVPLMILTGIVLTGFIYFLPSLWAYDLYKGKARFYKTLILNIVFGLFFPAWIILIL
jgi:hypothetical protein